MNETVILHFDPALSYNAVGKHVRDGLSTVIRTGDNLWLSCDERTTIERLTCTGNHTFSQHQSFKFSDYLDLPGGEDKSEIDIEGMGMDEHYLWLVGSHSLKRKKPRKTDSPEKQMRRLGKITADPNRYLLARIPMVRDPEGNYSLHKKHPHPDNPSVMLRAGILKGGKNSNQLLEALQQDEHIAPFLTIPGKDNGFDIEGLAVSGRRVYIGLRGPVLRGWAIVLEIELEEEKEGILTLKQLTDKRPYKKHFLHLRGKGIRELRIVGQDMYILAGPTMDLDGVIAIYRWRNAVGQATEMMVHSKDLERLTEVPHGYGDETGKDKAEGLAVYDEHSVLVVFDSPRDARKLQEDAITAARIKLN